MGKPKQLLSWAGATLLRHAVGIVRGTDLQPAVVVLGANGPALAAHIADMAVHCVINPNWEKGIGSSIAFGVHAMEEVVPDLEGVLIVLHDQPFITPTLLKRLVPSGGISQITAASYGDTFGVPAFFPSAYLPELKALDGPDGAKKIISRHPLDVVTVPMPEALADIDTPADYLKSSA
jgi:molybdenum cofactor cytidylyltransferase